MTRNTDAICPKCDAVALDICVAEYPLCECGTRMEWLPKMGAGSVVSDEIDVVVHNAICNPDGTPKRYTSKTEMRAAAAAGGWVNHVERGNTDRKTYDRLTKITKARQY